LNSIGGVRTIGDQITSTAVNKAAQAAANQGEAPGNTAIDARAMSTSSSTSFTFTDTSLVNSGMPGHLSSNQN